MEIPLKPTSTTKIDKIFNTWNTYQDACVEDPDYTTEEQARFRNVAISDLHKLGARWVGPNGSAIINDCIVLVRPQ